MVEWYFYFCSFVSVWVSMCSDWIIGFFNLCPKLTRWSPWKKIHHFQQTVTVWGDFFFLIIIIFYYYYILCSEWISWKHLKHWKFFTVKNTHCPFLLSTTLSTCPLWIIIIMINDGSVFHQALSTAHNVLALWMEITSSGGLSNEIYFILFLVLLGKPFLLSLSVGPLFALPVDAAVAVL